MVRRLEAQPSGRNRDGHSGWRWRVRNGHSELPNTDYLLAFVNRVSALSALREVGEQQLWVRMRILIRHSGARH